MKIEIEREIYNKMLQIVWDDYFERNSSFAEKILIELGICLKCGMVKHQCLCSHED
jgi:hypothetical protein